MPVTYIAKNDQDCKLFFYFILPEKNA